MKDKSNRLTVVNTGKKKPQKSEVVQQVVVPASSSSSHAPGFNPNLYLLKSVWDSVFEIKTDGSGQKYIFGKLPVVTKYGITMYADDGNVDIPQLAEGLPFDQRTIWFNPETKQIEVIGGTGGGEGGVSNFWDLSGIPSWITNSKPIYSYSEIKNTPDLSVFITDTELGSTLADYATLSYLTGELKEYVTLDGEQDITGVKDFINGLKIGGLPITKKQGDVVYLDANLVVRGGITMYGDGEGGSSVPLYSTLGSLLNVDESNDAVASVDRVLFQSAGSNVWSWKALSEIGGGSSGGGSVSGNYLPLSGGTINGTGDYLYVPLFVNALNNQISGITFQTNGTERGHVGYHYELGMRLHTASTAGIAVSNSDVPIFYTGNGSVKNTILHSGNISSYNAGSANRINAYQHNSDDKIIISGSRTDNTFPRKLVDNGYGLVIERYETGNVKIRNYIATLSDNVASATKLQTARTIWGQSFDGTGNVNGILTLNYNSSTAGIELTRAGSDECSIAFNNGYGRSVIGSWGGTTTLWIQAVGNVISANMTTGNVGIGTTSPSEKLQVEGNCWLKNGRLYALYASFDGIFSMTDKVNYTAARIGTFDRTEGGFVIQLGKHDVSNTAWKQQFNIIDSGWTASLFSVDRSGNVTANGGITMYSDQRKKTILNHVELSLKQIADAPLIQHYYNSDQEKTTHVGSIAQYWAGLNDWFCKLDAEGYYTMEIQNCALASAISIARHLEKYESKTDKKIRQLKKRISQLEGELELLKKGV